MRRKTAEALNLNDVTTTEDNIRLTKQAYRLIDPEELVPAIIKFREFTNKYLSVGIVSTESS